MYKYECNIFKYGDDWVCEFPDLKGCTGIGNNEEEALADGLIAKDLWLEDYFDEFGKYPEPSDVRGKDYSGNFLIRASKSLHRSLSIAAQDEEVSLNALCCQYLAEAVGERRSRMSMSFDVENDQSHSKINPSSWVNDKSSLTKVIDLSRSA